MIDELARLGTATVHEASGRAGVVDADLVQVVPGSRAAGPARTVLCAQGDNTMIHAAIATAAPGDVLAITMPEPAPYGAVGELLAIQAKARGIAGILLDLAVRDVAELVAVGLPIWARWVRVRGTAKGTAGALDVPVVIGGQTIRPRDAIVMDADGAVVVAHERLDEVVVAARARAAAEAADRERFRAGELSYDRFGLRAAVEGREGDE